VRGQWRIIATVCIAATVAWVIATEVAGHDQPFFAPIAAVIAVMSGMGHRRWIIVELAVGVSVGVLVGELLLGLIGRGAWQLALIVALAACLAIWLDVGRIAVTQACTSAILLATVNPVADTMEAVALSRFVDALIGSLAGLLFSTALAPNPLRSLQQDVGRVLSELADLLETSALALRWGDAGVAWTALQQGRALEGPLQGLSEQAASSQELARISPLRWRQRSHVSLYARSLRYVDHAVRDSRVLARRVHTMLRRGQLDAVAAAPALDELARAVRIFADDLAERDRFDEVRGVLLDVARTATDALPPDGSLGLTVVVAQVRALAADLIYATGTTSAELDGLLEQGDERVDPGG
jgi:uncharacterized membrane protein YgaE (UPF0421/DUF939 family)